MGYLRSFLLYVAWFVVCLIIFATVLDTLPVAFQILFAFTAPAFVVRSLNKRRRDKMALSYADRETDTGTRLHSASRRRIDDAMQSASRVPPLFAEDSRMARRIARVWERSLSTHSFGKKQEPVRHATPLPGLPVPGSGSGNDSTTRRSSPSVYIPNQNNSELIAAGRAARADLTEAAKKYAKASLEGTRLPSTEERDALFLKQASSSQNQASTPKHRDRLQGKGAHDEGVPVPRQDPPRQDNKALIAAGQAARADLERAALTYAKDRSVETGTGSVHDPRPEKSCSAQKDQVAANRSASGWVLAGQEVEVAGRLIKGMVYVGTPPKIADSYYRSSRAYIVPSLPVAAGRGFCAADDLGYWPDYSQISASCRGAYLDWLAGGADDPAADTGFVFLYFYGLERRMFLDDPQPEEREQLVAEATRLRAIYGLNHSVARYVGEFIEAATIVSSDAHEIEPFFESHGWELPLRLRVKIGALIRDDERLSAEWLLSWFLCAGYVSLRTPARRCPEEFRALFTLLFEAKYPQGLKVRKPKAELSSVYRAASSEFEKRLPLLVDGRPVPDIITLGGPLNKAREFADEACDALDAYSRYLGRNPEARGSLEAHALLPAALSSQFACEAMDKLDEWSRGIIEGGGLVPVTELLERLEGTVPLRIGKRQLSDAANLLSGLGIGMAPDPRFALRAPRIGEPVVLFDLGETAPHSSEVSNGYKRALLEMALGSLVAHADGRMVDAERERLIKRADTAPVANEAERLSLQANRVWFETVRPDIKMLRTALKNADEAEILVLRAAAVAMAHADLAVVPEEVAGIESIYKALGLDRSLVYADLHSRVPASGPVSVRGAVPDTGGETIAPEGFVSVAGLNFVKIEEIRSDTQKVASVLAGIFNSDSNAAEVADRPHHGTAGGSEPKRESDPGEAWFTNLDAVHQSFLASLLTKAKWSEGDLMELASSAGLPMAGMIETVNEWSFEEHGEMLIDDYDGYELSAETAEAIRANMMGNAKCGA